MSLSTVVFFCETQIHPDGWGNVSQSIHYSKVSHTLQSAWHVLRGPPTFMQYANEFFSHQDWAVHLTCRNSNSNMFSAWKQYVQYNATILAYKHKHLHPYFLT